MGTLGNMSRPLVLLSLLAVCTALPAPSTMLAVQASGTPCSKPGFSCVKERAGVPIPTAGPNQLLLRMHAASVNPVNVDLVEPECATIFACSKGTIGNDGAGTVTTVGANCSGLKPGDAVWGFPTGAYAQYAVVNCGAAGPKPSSLSFEDAGSLPVVATTALQCVHAAGMPSSKKNLTVVVTSGQGGTGFMMIQIAKALGATRVITAATGAGIAFVKGIGADQVVDYHQQTLAEALPTDSVDIVIDNLGVPGTADKIMPAIRSGGTFLVLMGGNRGTISKHPKNGVKQVQFGLAQTRRTDLDELKGLFEQGKLEARTMKPIYTLAEVPAGFNRLRSHGVLGKIVIAIE